MQTMNPWPLLILVPSLAVISACQKQMPPPDLCNVSWYRSIESNLSTSDGMGHGPDIGSDEWKSVIEFKLGIRDKPEVPDRDSPAWCHYINDHLKTWNRPT